MSQTLCIYNIETKEIEASITGQDSAACESYASEHYGDTDIWGWAYGDAELIHVIGEQDIDLIVPLAEDAE